MRFAFIDAWKEVWSVEFLCRVMQVTSRGFRAWRCRPMSQRQRDDMVLLAHIREQHRLSLQSYGRPRMAEELQELGLNFGHRRVGRLMRDNGIKILRNQKEIYGYKGQLPHVQHCAQPTGSGFFCRWPKPKVGWRHILYLD